MRISGQLIEAATGRHIWADRFDGDLADIFDLQDRITTSVVVAVEPSLRLAEIERAQRKPTDNLDAYDLYLQAFPPSTLTHGMDLRRLRPCCAVPSYSTRPMRMRSRRWQNAWCE